MYNFHFEYNFCVFFYYSIIGLFQAKALFEELDSIRAIKQIVSTCCVIRLQIIKQF